MSGLKFLRTRVSNENYKPYAGGDVWMLKETIIDNIANILSVIAIVCGIISIKIARDSLTFSQRSMLIKDSYEPILNDIKNNRENKLDSSLKFEFGNLRKIKQSYLYLAFEDNDRKHINSILEAEKKVNEFKMKANSYAESAINRVLNKELLKRGSEEIVVSTNIGNNQGHTLYNLNKNLYDILMNNELSYSIATDNTFIWCETGRNYTVTAPEGYEYETLQREYLYKMSNFLEQHFNLEVDLQNPEEIFFLEFERFEKEMIKELTSMPSYQEAKTEFENLMNFIDELESTIIERIKKLIIP